MTKETSKKLEKRINALYDKTSQLVRKDILAEWKKFIQESFPPVKPKVDLMSRYTGQQVYLATVEGLKALAEGRPCSIVESIVNGYNFSGHISHSVFSGIAYASTRGQELKNYFKR